ncbi:hypothetical protein ACFE04_022200 [Oxalis oulophora]
MENPKPKLQKSSSTEKTDYTSELSIDILHKILLCLPFADQFCASLLSNTWKSAYDSLTILDLDESIILTKRIENKSNKGYSRDTFKEFTEKAITRKCGILRTFKLDMCYCNYFDGRWMDRCIGLLPKNSLKVLQLNFTSYTHNEYKLSDYILEFSCLNILKLKYCEFNFDKSSLGGRIEFINLKELELVSVKIDDSTLYEIIRRCPIITNLQLIRCFGLSSNLQIWSLPNQFKSVKVVLEGGFESSSIEINCSTLQRFSYGGLMMEINTAPVLTCINLVDLTLVARKVTIDEKKFESVISMFPFLSTLVIKFETGMPKLRISNPSLKILKISRMRGLREADIHAPSLEALKISLFLDDKDHLKSLISIDAAKLQKFELKMKQSKSQEDDDCIKLYTSWFVELREFLKQFVHKVILTLTFEALQPMWNPDDIPCICTLPPTAIEQLNVGIKWNLCGKYREFLDGLFWSCHPNSLFLSLPNYVPRRPCINLSQRLWMAEMALESSQEISNVTVSLTEQFGDIFQNFYEIIETADNPTLCCCNSFRCKCWHHYLKSYQINDYDNRKIINCKDYLRFASQLDRDESSYTQTPYWDVKFEFSFSLDK